MLKPLLFAAAPAWVRRGLLALALLPAVGAQAQSLSYLPGGAVSVAGTYTDLGTAGTAIATANADDANSGAQNIGFTFNFNGTAFTQFVLNTNGFVRLGATAPSTGALFLSETAANVDPILSQDPADINILAPFNMDLMAGTAAGGTEYRVATTGTQPNRVCTVQWKNVSDKAAVAATQYASFSFQLKLYEADNTIDFVYGPTVAGTGTPDFRYSVVGIKGSGLDNGQTVLAEKPGSNLPWSATMFRTGYYPTTNVSATTFSIDYTHNIRGNVPADLGRTYRFTQLGVVVYTLGTVASYASPVAVQARVFNNSATPLTNLPVTLAVSGTTTFTNTQTVASLAAGASALVTFTPYPLSATSGTNTVAVSVPATAAAPTISQAVAQAISPTNLSYQAPNLDVTNGVGLAQAGNVVAVGYRTTGPAVLTTVTPTFYGSGTAGSTYQVVVYAAATGGQPGAVLYTSPARPRPSANAITPDAVAIPSTPVSGSFFVGVKTIGADNIELAYQDEIPLRASTFFLSTDGTTWSDLNAQTNISPRLAIDVTLGPGAATCAPVTALTATPTGATTATVAFTAGSGNTSYTVTYTPAGGTARTVSPAPTASPVLLTGLTGGTAYTVSVVGNCGGGTATAATATFTTGVPTATRNALGTGVVAAFPNPASRAFTLSLPAIAGARTAAVALYNALGQQMQARTITLAPAGTQALLDVSSLAPGLYTVRVQAGSQSASLPVTLQ
ncbi:T9SS type A sorting domain-containing protein [Hymenobacter nivis]|uniref:T9SS C-terminal target domain-containing protein n=1 Tax=Hymenobacter nivis TaxID=1850093 RepID=A0A502GM15_9BACT|nr:T9SS type A sorting domain-containing protein [Hymenobacter nivis]TPG62340.1 T9SS C-terminal target domain-containing protein [Hymenobacter nivis]